MTTSASGVVLSEPDFWLGHDQLAAFSRIRQSNPIEWQPEPQTAWAPQGTGYWSITSHDLVREVSKAPEVFGSRYGTEIMEWPKELNDAGGMLNMDDPEHARLRNIVNRAFMPRRIAAVMDDVAQRADRLVQHLVDLGEFDFVSEVADTFPASIIGSFMGVDPVDLPHLVALTKQSLSPPEELVLPAINEIMDYGKTLAAERKKNPTDDLVSVITHADVDGGSLTPHEVGVFFGLLLTAGIETTGTALNHAMIALDRFPEQRELWASDPARHSPLALEEVFRWASPVRRFRRTALVDAEIGGQKIAAGDKVVMWYMSANRDASVFTEPDTLNITRNPNPHVAFGAGGPHFCLGANLARTEVKAFIENLLTKAPRLKLSGDPEYAQNDQFNVVASLPVQFA